MKFVDSMNGLIRVGIGKGKKEENAASSESSSEKSDKKSKKEKKTKKEESSSSKSISMVFIIPLSNLASYLQWCRSNWKFVRER